MTWISFRFPRLFPWGIISISVRFPLRIIVQQPRWTQRIQPKGFRVPPAVVIVLVLVVLVGVPLFSYLALNIPRVAGTSMEGPTDKNNQAALEPAKPAATAPSESESPQVFGGAITRRGCRSVRLPGPGTESRTRPRRGSKVESKSDERCRQVALNRRLRPKLRAGRISRPSPKRRWRSGSSDELTSK